MRKLKNEIVTVGVDTCVVVPVHKRLLRGKMKDFTLRTLAIIALLIEVLGVVFLIAYYW